jgi:hypothetical protein
MLPNTTLYKLHLALSLIVGGILLIAGLHYLYFVFTFLPGDVLLSSDSLGYTGISSYRTLGYPLFIHFCAFLFGDLFSIAIIQNILHVIAIWYFCYEILRFYKSHAFTVCLGIALIYSYACLEYPHLLLTEELFFCALCLVWGLFLRMLRKSSGLETASCWPAIAFGLAIPLSISIRPVGVFFLPAIPFLFIFFPARSKFFAKHLFTSLIVGSFLVCSLNLYSYGFFGFSKFAGFTTLANTMLLLKEDTPSKYPELARQLYEAGAPFRAELKAAKSEVEKYRVMSFQSSQMIGLGAHISRIYASQNPKIIQPLHPKNLEAVLSALGQLSPLNAKLIEISLKYDPRHIPLNNALQNIATNAYFHNLKELVPGFARKFYFGVEQLLLRLPAAEKKAKIFDKALYDFSTNTLPSKNEVSYPINISMAEKHFYLFNKTQRWLYLLDEYKTHQYFYAPRIVCWGAAIFILAQLIAVYFFKIKKDWIGSLAFLAICFFAYFSSVVFAQVIGTPRYYYPIFPLTLTFFFLPLLLIETSLKRIAASFPK